MTSRIARRPGTLRRRIASALLITALIFAPAISRQAQTEEPKPRSTTTTPRQLTPSEQKNIKLERVVFQKDMKAISYGFKYNNTQRIITYRVGKDNSVRVDVRETPKGKPFIELFATKAGLQARTPAGKYKLIKGKRVLPTTTDALSVWLLAQNFVKNPTTTPKVLYDKAFAQLAKNSKPGSIKQPEDTRRMRDRGEGIFGIWVMLDDLLDWLFESECEQSAEEVTCTETDAYGNTNIVHYRCDECGQPYCNEVRVTTTVVATIYDSDTRELRQSEETVTYTICQCHCLEFSVFG